MVTIDVVAKLYGGLPLAVGFDFRVGQEPRAPDISSEA